MQRAPLCVWALLVWLAVLPAFSQETGSPREVPAAMPDQQTIEKLLKRLTADEARIQELEDELGLNKAPAPAAEAAPATAVLPPAPESAETTNATPNTHTIEIPGGGPTLQVRGFMDLNYGVGSDANPLIYTLNSPRHSGFQAGEFTLMMSSQLSEKFSFVTEATVAADSANVFAVDLDRYLLSYRASKYFEAGVGGYHTAIGYYSTAYHHAAWFQTATGRPFMYFFEDTGGLLPVHNVGVTFTGVVPGASKLGLHWIAEVGNGRASNKDSAQVQSFYTDRHRKGLNLAAYIAPEAIHGLQIGGSFYSDRLAPQGLARVDQKISSLYAIYLTAQWEFFNEAVLLSNHPESGGRTFNTPLAYTQISHKFGAWRPYVRYQYVHSPESDPINLYTGLYMGPSFGVRHDFTDYAAFKLQYNRLDQHAGSTHNGLDTQVAFTF